MRKIFLPVMVVLGCLVVGAVWVLRDPRPLANFAQRTMERAFPGVRVAELKIGEQHFFWPGEAVFEDVSCVLKIAGRILVVKVKTLEISGMSTFFSSHRNLFVHVAGADVDFLPGKARGITADLGISLPSKRAVTAAGSLTAEAVIWDRIKAGKTSFLVKINAATIEACDIHAEVYGGRMSGTAHVMLKPVTYAADLKLDGLQTAKLAEVNEQISAQMAGRISGIVRIAGDGTRPNAIETDLQMPSGGKINAALLSALTQYLPQSQERKMLEALIKNGGKLAVEVFSFTMKSHAPDKLSGLIKIASKQANMELNLTHDIKTDGTWDGLAQSWQAIFK